VWGVVLCVFAVVAIGAPVTQAGNDAPVAESAKKKCKKGQKLVKGKCKKKKRRVPAPAPVAPPVTPPAPPVVPNITVTDDDTMEGDFSIPAQVQFTVNLSAPTTQSVQVTVQTEDGTATAPADYTAMAPTVLTFNPGQTSKLVVVSTPSDRVPEPTETFKLKLSAPVNGVITDSEGIGTITDFDTPANNETGAAAEADFCRLDSTGVMHPGMVLGRLFETGVTEPNGAPTGVLAMIGLGPLGTDPRSALDWAFIGSAWFAQEGNDDRYQRATEARTPGTYSLVYRFSLDSGASWTYCDLDGAGSSMGNDFSIAQLGTVTFP
jgi:hypothetical protein